MVLCGLSNTGICNTEINRYRDYANRTALATN